MNMNTENYNNMPNNQDLNETNQVTPPPFSIEAQAVTMPEQNQDIVSGDTNLETPNQNSKKGPNRLVFILIGFIGIILLVSVSATFLVLSGGENNPLAQGSGSVMGVILLILAMLFGFTAIAGLVTSLVGIFKVMNTSKEDKATKKKFSLTVAVGILTLILGIAGLVFATKSITGNANKALSSYILTNPSETTGLTAPTTIIFDAGSVPIDTNSFKIIGYNWSFGDGEVATGQTVTHTFTSKPASGIYTVTLKVSYQDAKNPNAEIQEQQFTKVISIENEQVFASFTFTPDQGQAPLKVEFDASESKDPDGQIVKYEWDFNEDGIYDAEGRKTSYEFTEVGTYNVTLKVTDNNGQSNTESNIVTVKSDQIILADVKNSPSDQVLTPGRAYQFDASLSSSSEGTIIKYEWNFGNGKTGVGRRVTQSYEKEGVYELSLTLTDDAGNFRVYTKNYTVSNSPSGLFAKITSVPAANLTSADGMPLLKGTAPLKVNFDGGASSGASIVDYKWDFENDGTTDATGQQVENIYTKSGLYNVLLTITSADGKSANVMQKIEVTGSGLEARVSANPVNGIVPLTVTFDATATRIPENESIVAYRWDFNDGTPLLTSDSPIVTHKFNSVGNFKIKTTAITATNKTSSAEINIIVTSTPLKSCFTLSRKIGPAPLSVEFNPQCSTGTIAGYTWKFANLGVSNERRPIYTFTTPGEYEIELEISDSGNNISSFKDTITVQ